MRRLYLQIYLGFVLIALMLSLAVSALFAWHRPDRGPVPHHLAAMAELIGRDLPAPDRAPPELQAGVTERARSLRLHITVWSSQGEVLAHSGTPLPGPRIDSEPTAWIPGRRGPPGVAVRLEDGRWLGLALPRDRRHAGGAWLGALALLGAVIAAGSYPVARRIARRLERLSGAVERLGAGDLSSRVPVEGRDEVSELARSFNRAADRIQDLVNAQRRMLASASHELRSPLARLRLAVELMGPQASPELRAEAERDIAELDDLIEDVLLAARLESVGGGDPAEPVDLLALAAEEASRVGAEVSGGRALVTGNPRLLRRLVRNLFENARRHGSGSSVEARVEALPEGGAGARLAVADRGPGVPESERIRIFEPFYRRADHSEGRDGGVGLGLALVREIARHHGGEARCLARPGGGTVFEVDLRGIATVR